MSFADRRFQAELVDEIDRRRGIAAKNLLEGYATDFADYKGRTEYIRCCSDILAWAAEVERKERNVDGYPSPDR